jgi:hypothetical protein
MKIVVVGPVKSTYSEVLIGLHLEVADIVQPGEVPSLYPKGAYAIDLSVVRHAIFSRGNPDEILLFERAWGDIGEIVAAARSAELQIIVPTECCEVIEGAVH